LPFKALRYLYNFQRLLIEDTDFESIWITLWWAHAPNYGTFVSLWLLMEQIGEEELSRKEELDQVLDYFSQQLEELEVVSVLPDDIEQRDYVLNRALDVRSASMLYLAVHLHHGSTAFGTLGTATSSFNA
jgi:hypothetical protein